MQNEIYIIIETVTYNGMLSRSTTLGSAGWKNENDAIDFLIKEKERYTNNRKYSLIKETSVSVRLKYMDLDEYEPYNKNRINITEVYLKLEKITIQ